MNLTVIDKLKEMLKLIVLLVLTFIFSLVLSETFQTSFLICWVVTMGLSWWAVSLQIEELFK